MNEEIKEILNKIYEAEGLLELMRLRQEKSLEIYPMIVERLAEVNRLVGAMKVDKPVQETREETTVIETPDSEDAPDENFEYDLDDEPKPDDESRFDYQPEYQPEPETEQEFKTEPVEPESVVRSEPTVNLNANEQPKKRPALCLNDRFRFRRALFGGSDSELNAVLDRIATLRDFEDAENYLYGELGFEPDDEVVADLMEIVKSYFER